MIKTSTIGISFQNEDLQIMKITRNFDGEGWIIDIKNNEFWVPSNDDFLAIWSSIHSLIFDQDKDQC